ncbi:MAG: hypothetical protein LBD82_01160 [Deltaproteobacteria bacterium]|jgi:UDP-3-O-[3-hydroxymyristoyl] glucosamine N-acyltransferase|nr:hypothetical protein [Deltaproteobacteria bacterium]
MSATSLLAIYGAGGVGRELRELAAQAAGHTRKIALVADAKFAPTLPEGPAFFWEEFCRRFPPGKACFIIGVGDPEQRAALAAKVQATGYSLERFIHPAAHVSGSARIEQGAVIYPGVFVSCGARLGYNTLLMAQAVLGHDTVLGEHSVGAADDMS